MTEIKYRDKVLVTEGFHKGRTGVVTNYHGHHYLIDFGFFKFTEWVHTDYLEVCEK